MLRTGLSGMVGRPPPRPSPTNCVGEGERQKAPSRGIKFSSPPAVRGGRGRVRGGGFGRSSMYVLALGYALAGLRSGIEFSPSPAQRGRGSGGGGPRGRSSMPFVEAPTLGNPTSPSSFWGRWASNASPEGALARSHPYSECPMYLRLSFVPVLPL